MSDSPAFFISSDRLDEETVIVELSDGTSVCITIADILSHYPDRKAHVFDDPDSPALS